VANNCDCGGDDMGIFAVALAGAYSGKVEKKIGAL
jgi:hypothetical protein